jgi:leucyl-tRNA synthetase
MEYKFADIEKKWQQWWKEKNVYKVNNNSDKPKYYVLDMFPYPSGAGLHVGHPLGYIASDIYARFKRLKGFNVLHPMGYDAFGLPAEQYAMDHGIHPAISTEDNINNFRKQLDNVGFSFDWSREVRTSDPKFYKWTQWIFLHLFKSFFNRNTNKAEPIENLKGAFEREGNVSHPIPDSKFELTISNFEFRNSNFSAAEWKSFDEFTQQSILMEYRLAYCGYGEVNWCEALGTVLANDEVVNGVSERGGYPVVKKRLRQWYLRITEYADRLLEGLEKVDFSEAMKEMQTNWIGKSYGAEIEFRLTPNPSPRGEGSDASSSAASSTNEDVTGHFFKTADQSYWGTLKQFGRDNRKNPTEAENILWQKLRNNQLGVKVRRQHSISGFIVDFAILQAKLVIEVDGEYHHDSDQRIYDEARENFLKESNFDLIRFANDDVVKNADQVVDKIKNELQKRKQSEGGKLPLLREEKGSGDEARSLRVYTTRPDTIFGVDFMVIAPEHELIEQITSAEQKQVVDEYVGHAKSRSERERMAEKKISGVFTGAYCVHPFSKKEIPIWVSEYVLIGYGTGAIMAVPCGDERDHKFAKHFGLEITNIIGSHYNGQDANPTEDAILENSDFLNGIVMKDAIELVIEKLEEEGIGERKVNYKMRDAAFSRQRYWGEPIPITWKNGIAYPLDEKELPLELPHVESYKPGPEGEGPLANIPEWTARNLETNTMPGYAGSSWYFLRYMDPHDENEFCSRDASDYWGQVDLYIGGTEHAVGHLLYSRMWTNALCDLGYIGYNEPYKKLVNQGKIGGDSRIVYRIQGTNTFVSAGLKDEYETNELHADVNLVDGYELDIDAFKKWKPDFEKTDFILEDGKYICGSRLEKMSKRYFNVVNPDDVVKKYGADTFRMYEMFLGPVEQDKPWDTKGIEGVHRFLKKFWRLFVDEKKGLVITDDPATRDELKTLHKTIKKIEEDTERFSFNTGVSAFMIATNELIDLKCHKRSILEPLVVLIAPYAPHIAEEVWHLLGQTSSVVDATYPKFEEKFVREASKNYPVAINGKTRTELTIALDATQEQVEELVLGNDVVRKWMQGKPPKKVIYVKNKMVNVVV